MFDPTKSNKNGDKWYTNKNLKSIKNSQDRAYFSKIKSIFNQWQKQSSLKPIKYSTRNYYSARSQMVSPKGKIISRLFDIDSWKFERRTTINLNDEPKIGKEILIKSPRGQELIK